MAINTTPRKRVAVVAIERKRVAVGPTEPLTQYLVAKDGAQITTDSGAFVTKG